MKPGMIAALLDDDSYALFTPAASPLETVTFVLVMTPTFSLTMPMTPDAAFTLYA